MRTVIIILNWNNAEETIACIQSVLCLDKSKSNFDIIIVDNLSNDGSWEAINKKIFSLGYSLDKPNVETQSFRKISKLRYFSKVGEDSPCIYFARSIGNLGFSGGNNNGIEIGLRMNADYFWIINNDVLVDSNSLLFLEKRMNEDENIGICGAHVKKKIGDVNTTQCLGGNYFNPITGRGGALLPEHFDTPATNLMIESRMTYVSGACMFISRDFILNIGLLDERFFLFCEEIDLAYRSKSSFTLGVEIDAVVYHKEGATIGTAGATEKKWGSNMSEFYQAQSKLLVTCKHNKPYLISVSVFLLLRAAKAFVKGNLGTAFAILSAFCPSKRRF